MEIGQVSALIETPETASQIVQDLLQTYQKAKESLYT